MQSKLSLIVLAVAVLALGVAAYALTQAQSSPAAAPGPGPNASLDAAISDFEARLKALEAALLEERGALDPTPRILEKLDDLDRRLSALAAGRGGELPPAETLPPGEPDGKAAAAGEPDAEEVERFQKLKDAAERQERIKRRRKQIDEVLAKLEINLTDKQRDQLSESWGDFQTRRGRIWGEAKRNGAAASDAVDWRQIITDTNGIIEREFTEIIRNVLPGTDAERIATGLNSGGK